MTGLRKTGETFSSLVVSRLLMSFRFTVDNPSLFKAVPVGEVFLNL